MKNSSKRQRTTYIVTSEFGSESIEKTVEKIIELFEKKFDKKMNMCYNDYEVGCLYSEKRLS